ncbi:MAG: lycopene cyclase domain-containing protein [Actinobacteria bacterium]|nr:lycopene cyclase domain-containing protein [Actinomycetota bacterium]
MTYTVSVLVALAVAAIVDLGLLRTFLLGRRVFWVSYAIVLVFQLVVNGILTGWPIVRYDPRTILGTRVVEAPVEDLLFGFSLALLTLSIWVALGRRAARAPHGPGRARRRSPAA